MGFETSGPNEALIVSGMCHKTPLLVPGGRVFVWPWIQKCQRISLNIMTIVVESPKIFTKLGVPISVTGIAQVRIEGQKREMLHNACQQFLGKTPEQINRVANETLEGHQRAIMGTMTVEEIYQDRQKFSVAVFEVASRDLLTMGINVVSYTIKDISDETGYLLALGKKRTAEVLRDARIGEAEAKKETGIKESRARQQEEASKFQNKTKIAEAERDFNLQKLTYDMEIQTKKASSVLSYDLQSAKTKQKIRQEQMGVLVVERSKAIEVQEQEIIRRERELEAEIKKPSLAEKYRLETLAEANKNAEILRARAEAESIKAKGDAEAFAIHEKAKAEAEAMQKKAEALQEYEDAALVDMVLKTLPKMVAEVSAPLAGVDKITMVAGSDGKIGLSRLTGEVMDIVERLPKTVQAMTGVDMVASVKSMTA